MEMQEVKSSTIAHVGYDDETKVLTVRFRSGGVYVYADVSTEAHQALMSAESVGKHFQANIRDKYVTRKLDEPQEPAQPPADTLQEMVERVVG